jgi:hypothetical protein
MPMTTEPKRPTLDERRRAEVERAVAPYRGKVPDFMLEKLRELADRYWRENATAARALQLQDARGRAKSGTVATGDEAHDRQDPAAAGGEEG